MKEGPAVAVIRRRCYPSSTGIHISPAPGLDNQTHRARHVQQEPERARAAITDHRVISVKDVLTIKTEQVEAIPQQAEDQLVRVAPV